MAGRAPSGPKLGPWRRPPARCPASPGHLAIQVALLRGACSALVSFGWSPAHRAEGRGITRATMPTSTAHPALAMPGRWRPAGLQGVPVRSGCGGPCTPAKWARLPGQRPPAGRPGLSSALPHPAPSHQMVPVAPNRPSPSSAKDPAALFRRPSQSDIGAGFPPCSTTRGFLQTWTKDAPDTWALEAWAVLEGLDEGRVLADEGASRLARAAGRGGGLRARAGT